MTKWLLAPGVVLGWFNFKNKKKSVNVIHHINKSTTVTHMIISTYAEQPLEKIQHLFLHLILAKRPRNNCNIYS